jgi:hypothetical protein
MHLSADHCIFIVNGNGNSGSVRRVIGASGASLPSESLCRLGSRWLAAYGGIAPGEAISTDRIAATQPHHVKFQSHGQDAKFLIAA